MKIKAATLGLISFLITSAVLAQGIENDDMYFNSKDRAKLNASKASEMSYSASIKKTKKEQVADEAVNPTDSYSARNVNPEYQARSNSQTAQADNQDYFVNNYKYNNASSFNSWNNNFNNWYSNPWYGGNYYDPYINSFYSPYYGSSYDMYGNPWCNPYYRSGWSSSFSYHWGGAYNYGWGMNFGYGNYGYNPYNSWAMMGMMSYPIYGSSYYGGYGYYPTQVVVVESGFHGPVYGKRSSRSSTLASENGRVARSYSRPTVSNGGTVSDRPTIGGRTSSSVSSQSDYYNRGWRNQTQQNTGSSYTSPNYNSGNSGNSNTRSSWESNTRSSWNESNTGNSSRSTFDSGRSSSSYSGGNSGGSSSGSSSSGSRSSGRGH